MSTNSDNPSTAPAEYEDPAWFDSYQFIFAECHQLCLDLKQAQDPEERQKILRRLWLLNAEGEVVATRHGHADTAKIFGECAEDFRPFCGVPPS